MLASTSIVKMNPFPCLGLEHDLWNTWYPSVRTGKGCCAWQFLWFCLLLTAKYVNKNTATDKTCHQGKEHEGSQEEVKVRTSDPVKDRHNNVVLNLDIC